MNQIYANVKAAVRPREAAERYGLAVSQGGMARCPWHSDRTPSLKLYEDHFHCFGCGVHGDVIDLAGRLLGLSPRDAAARLAADFSMDIRQNYNPNQTQTAIHRNREAETMCFLVLADYLHLLEAWKRSCIPTAPEAAPDARYTEACRMLDWVAYLADILTSGSPSEQTALVKQLTESGWLLRHAASVTRRGVYNDNDGTGA